MLKKIGLNNFAKFSELTVNFSPKINVIIGENGTGKSQLLKAGYVANAALATGQEQSDLTEKLCATFRPMGNALGKLVKSGTSGSVHSTFEAVFSMGQRLNADFTSASKKVRLNHFSTEPVSLGSPVFLPTKEVLSLYAGITSDKSDRATLRSLFDATYMDLCEKLAVGRPGKTETEIEQDPRFGQVYQKLVNTIKGRFRLLAGLATFEPGEFQEQRAKGQHELNTRMESIFVPRTDERISAQMAAEGVRKLGILQLLLENRQLNPGTSGTLFWDEPEANMNPTLMRLVVELLLELSRNGQQIVLATHDYVLLKWFDLLRNKDKGDHVRFHALYRDSGTGQINIESTDDYLGITPNAIADAFNDLTKEQVRLKMGSLGK